MIVAYTYDNVGRLARKDLSNDGTTVYSYTSAGLLESVVNRASNGTVQSRFDYGYDSLGHVTSLTTLAGTFNYAYDAAGQLTSVALPSGRTIAYEYDAAGNRSAVMDSGTNTLYAVNALNQYTTAGADTLPLRCDGNLISQADAGGTTAFGYDDLNRLVAMTGPSGNWSYEYDALGRRSAVTHDGVRKEYLVDPAGSSHVVAEYEAAGALVAHYTHGMGLETRVGAGGPSAHYTFDGSRNTVGLTDANGVLLNSYSYARSVKSFQLACR